MCYNYYIVESLPMQQVREGWQSGNYKRSLNLSQNWKKIVLALFSNAVKNVNFSNKFEMLKKWNVHFSPNLKNHQKIAKGRGGVRLYILRNYRCSRAIQVGMCS